MKLYGYFRSSASFRVRIALNLKNVSYDAEFIHLTRGGGEQFASAFEAVNPQSLVPVLEDGGTLIPQSLAILEYLEETHPIPPLLPPSAAERARVRALAQLVACDIHPLQNLRVLKFLKEDLGRGRDDRLRWCRHWIALGLAAVEKLLDGHPAAGTFCHGERPTLADICLVPQIFNARRFDCDLSGYPAVMGVFDACMALPAFDKAQPSRQPDAE